MVFHGTAVHFFPPPAVRSRNANPSCDVDEIGPDWLVVTTRGDEYLMEKGFPHSKYPREWDRANEGDAEPR